MNSVGLTKGPEEDLKGIPMERKLQESKPECFVSGALAAVLRISRYAGIAPLRFVKKRCGWLISFSSSWNIFGQLMVLVFIIMTASVTVTKLQMDVDKAVRMRSKTKRVVAIMELCMTIVIAAMSVFGASRQMQNTITCLNKVQKINSDLHVHHWPATFGRKKIIIFVTWGVACVALSLTDQIQTAISFSLTEGVWLCGMYTFYYFCYWIQQLRGLQFIMMTLQVANSFRTVNDKLRSLLNAIADLEIEPYSNIQFNINKKVVKNTYRVNSVTDSGKVYPANGITVSLRSSHHETVHRLALIYASLCDVVRDVDQSHGPILLGLLCSSLQHLICTPYFLINSLFLDNISQDIVIHVLAVTVQLCWCLYHTFNLLMIIEPCHLTHVEMETTRELVSHLMCHSQSIYDPLAVELDQFVKHLVLNEVSYKPLKVTTMSRTLVITILGSVTTYLVIIVQL